MEAKQSPNEGENDVKATSPHKLEMMIKTQNSSIQRLIGRIGIRS